MDVCMYINKGDRCGIVRQLAYKLTGYCRDIDCEAEVGMAQTRIEENRAFLLLPLLLQR